MATLFRPVGLNELSMIWDLDFRGFPPRLANQPFFYPVAGAGYAREIAASWNVKDAASGFAGFVTQFSVSDGYLSTLEPHVVGNRAHVEYWIPAEQLEDFNGAITSRVVVQEAFFGSDFVGYIPPQFNLQRKSAVEQFVFFGTTFEYSPMDFLCEVSANRKAVYLNSWFWAQHDYTALGFDSVRKAMVMDHLRGAWARVVPNMSLPPLPRQNAGDSNAGNSSSRSI